MEQVLRGMERASFNFRGKKREILGLKSRTSEVEDMNDSIVRTVKNPRVLGYEGLRECLEELK